MKIYIYFVPSRNVKIGIMAENTTMARNALNQNFPDDPVRLMETLDVDHMIQIPGNLTLDGVEQTLKDIE